MDSQPKKLYRSRTNKVIAGVCGGLGEYFNIDPLIFRILFLAMVLGGGAGVVIYIILALVIPQAPNADPPAPNNSSGDIHARASDFPESVRQNAQELAEDIRKSVHEGGLSNARVTLGVVILIIGVFALFSQIFPFYWFHWDFFWPAIIILIGVLIITRKR